jgi:hypothetical protein
LVSFITAHLLIMSAAKANDAHHLAAHGKDQTVAYPGDPAKGAKSRFTVVAPAICPHSRIKIKPRKVGQRQAMLGPVDHIFRWIKFDVHKLSVVTFYAERKLYS